MPEVTESRAAPEGDDTPQHERFDPATARPSGFRGPFSEMWRWMCAAYLRLAGWRMEGDWPRRHRRLVLIAAPHTSNWAGINMLAAAGYYRIKLRWMGKKELTEGPFGPLVRWMGCVPVDRRGGGDLVGQMRAAFERAGDMVLAVSPEGTRAATPGWKTGYYHIAHSAGVPLVMSVLDYGARKIRLSGALGTSGDYARDFAIIQTHYRDARGLVEARFNAPGPDGEGG